LTIILVSACGSMGNAQLRTTSMQSAAAQPLAAPSEAPSELASYVEGALARPSFSHAAGWHVEPFELVISCAEQDAEIRFTLDGSEPNQTSPLYSEPIPIQDRTGQPNGLSLIQTSINFMMPAGPVFAGTSVRARAFKDGVMSPVMTATYLVDPEGAGRYGFPVLCISTDKANFFDYEKGIYVKGKIFDQNFDPDLPDWEKDANYMQSGSDWERPAYLEFFEIDGSRVLAQDIGIRIHGGATRSYMQKSLRLYARSLRDGDPKDFRYQIFPGLANRANGKPMEKFRRLILRTSGNDSQFTFFRDGLMTSLAAGTGLDTQAFRPSVVFLNGEYWGIHNIRERFDEYHFENTYKIDKDDVVILENEGILDVGKEGDEAPYLSMVEFIRNADMEDPAAYERVGTMMDIDNFIEYQAAQIYFGNRDWPGNNLKYWRARTDSYKPEKGRADGRWRWLLYDTDFGFSLYDGPEGYRMDTLAMAAAANGPEWPNPDWSTLIFRKLLKNPTFRSAFIIRLADRLNADYSPTRVKAAIEGFKALYEGEMAEHIARWRAPRSLDEWRYFVAILGIFADKRPDAVRGHVESMFKVKRATIELSWDASKGSVKVNSIIPASGQRLIYFAGVPVALNAEATDGYRFAGWSIADSSSGEARDLGADESIELALSGDSKVEARFEAAGK
jgi:hypothetical protein